MIERISSKETKKNKENKPNNASCGYFGIQDIQSEIENAIALQQVDTSIIREQEDKLERDQGASYVLSPKPLKEAYKHLRSRERIFLESYSVSPYYVACEMEDPNEEDTLAVLQFAPMSAGRFPDKLYEHLTGNTFKNKKDTVEGLEERAKQFDVVRQYFQNLKSISGRSNRMFVSEDGDNHGSILITRKPKFRKGAERYNNFYPDIYTAERAQNHIIQLYTGRYKQAELEGSGELDMLKILRSEFQRIISFLQNWKFATSGEKAKVQKILSQLEENLVSHTNLYKDMARERLSSAKSFEDKRKKQKNPPATSARLVGAYNDLLKRTEDIFKMLGVVMKDRDLLRSIREKVQAKFDRTKTDMDYLLDDKYFKSFDKNEVDSNYIKNNASRINKRIDNPHNNNGIINRMLEVAGKADMPAPFFKWAEAFLSNLSVARKLNESIQNGEVSPEDMGKTHDTICEYAVRANLVLRYQSLQRELFEMLEDILLKPDKLSAEKIQNRAFNLLKSFNPHFIGNSFDKREDLKFVEESFAEFTHYLNEVVSLTIQWQEERGNLYADSHKILKEKSSPVNEEKLQELVKNEDALNQLERSCLDKIYRTVGDMDFNKAIATLSVDLNNLL